MAGRQIQVQVSKDLGSRTGSLVCRKAGRLQIQVQVGKEVGSCTGSLACRKAGRFRYSHRKQDTG